MYIKQITKITECLGSDCHVATTRKEFSMRGATFKGGAHPFEGKDLSKDLPVKRILPAGELVFPLSQHIGAPAKPIVEPGDKVLVGQTIAEAGGFVSTDICSSVSGTVKKIEPRLTVSGAKIDSFIIENNPLLFPAESSVT